MTPDFETARQFLEIIAPDGEITFQIFGEGPGKDDPNLRRILHGTLEEHFSILGQLNQQGGGIFVMVNKGDGEGRKAQNVTGIRALFVDFDEDGAGKLAELESLQELARPNIVVESSVGRFHAYWLIDGKLPLDCFTPLQKRFAKRFGGDPAVCDLPRVMRLPGFFHQKGNLFPVRVVRACPAPGLPAASLAKLLENNQLQQELPEKALSEGDQKKRWKVGVK